jgi:hypothetical protein
MKRFEWVWERGSVLLSFTGADSVAGPANGVLAAGAGAVWAAIGSGASSEDAAVGIEVSQAVGTGGSATLTAWHRALPRRCRAASCRSPSGKTATARRGGSSSGWKESRRPARPWRRGRVGTSLDARTAGGTRRGARSRLRTVLVPQARLADPHALGDLADRPLPQPGQLDRTGPELRRVESPRRVRRPVVMGGRPRRGRLVDGSGLPRVRPVGCRRRPRTDVGG